MIKDSENLVTADRPLGVTWMVKEDGGGGGGMPHVIFSLYLRIVHFWLLS
jgi:hypothetical protein